MHARENVKSKIHSTEVEVGSVDTDAQLGPIHRRYRRRVTESMSITQGEYSFTPIVTIFTRHGSFLTMVSSEKSIVSGKPDVIARF
jgi:hypothetical protein